MSVDTVAKNILEKVNEGLQSMLEDTKTEIVQSVSANVKSDLVDKTATKVNKTVKLDRAPEFRRKGNERQ